MKQPKVTLEDGSPAWLIPWAKKQLARFKKILPFGGRKFDLPTGESVAINWGHLDKIHIKPGGEEFFVAGVGIISPTEQVVRRGRARSRSFKPAYYKWGDIVHPDFHVDELFSDHPNIVTMGIFNQDKNCAIVVEDNVLFAVKERTNATLGPVGPFKTQFTDLPEWAVDTDASNIAFSILSEFSIGVNLASVAPRSDEDILIAPFEEWGFQLANWNVESESWAFQFVPLMTDEIMAVVNAIPAEFNDIVDDPFDPLIDEYPSSPFFTWSTRQAQRSHFSTTFPGTFIDPGDDYDEANAQVQEQWMRMDTPVMFNNSGGTKVAITYATSYILDAELEEEGYDSEGGNGELEYVPEDPPESKMLFARYQLWGITFKSERIVVEVDVRTGARTVIDHQTGTVTYHVWYKVTNTDFSTIDGLVGVYNEPPEVVTWWSEQGGEMVWTIPWALFGSGAVGNPVTGYRPGTPANDGRCWSHNIRFEYNGANGPNAAMPATIFVAPFVSVPTTDLLPALIDVVYEVRRNGVVSFDRTYPEVDNLPGRISPYVEIGSARLWGHNYRQWVVEHNPSDSTNERTIWKETAIGSDVYTEFETGIEFGLSFNAFDGKEGVFYAVLRTISTFPDTVTEVKVYDNATDELIYTKSGGIAQFLFDNKTPGDTRWWTQEASDLGVQELYEYTASRDEDGNWVVDENPDPFSPPDEVKFEGENVPGFAAALISPVGLMFPGQAQ